MSVPVPHDKITLNKIKYSVRASQAVVQYSVGSMVDFPDQTLMTAAPEQWEDSVVRIHDERLENLLHVNYFGMPGSKDLKQFYRGISYVRFPEWYFCPKCRSLKPINEWIRDYRRLHRDVAENDPYLIKHMNCPRCRVGLVVARIVTACEKGHISDFPWVEWAHARDGKPLCENPQMSLHTSPTAAEGLEGIIVSCACGARSSLSGAFNSDALQDLERLSGGRFRFKCKGLHPWKNGVEICDSYPKVLQRGASSVYFPVVESSLVIPPFSGKDTSAIENCEKYKDLITSIQSAIQTLSSINQLTPENELNTKKSLIASAADEIAVSTSIPKKTVAEILERKLCKPDEPDTGEIKTTQNIRYKIEEYEALGSETPHAPNDGDFSKEIIDASKYGLPYVKSVSLIHKIREVAAIVGFSRIKPVLREESANNGPSVVSIKESATKWYPAYETRGEGIFIEFDGVKIDKWISETPSVRERASHIDEAYRNSVQSTQNKTARYIMLHTLSHLLIKQLSFECGYGIASLKERIYCGEKSEGKDMAAIFIYTANGDSEGTLGGLVRQGRPDCFPSIFKKALRSAIICSNDPVCSMSKGQGRDSVNLAACHSCALIPETSCEKGNLCLDRGMLVGTFAEHDIGIFSPYLFDGKKWDDPSSVSRSETVSDSTPGIITPTHPSSSARSLRVTDKGTDLQSNDSSTIWQSYLSYASSEAEKETYQKLITYSPQFDALEKPHQDSTLTAVDTGEEIHCSLMWEKRKILFFSEDDESDYNVAKEYDWRCIFVKEGNTVPEDLINALRGE